MYQKHTSDYYKESYLKDFCYSYVRKNAFEILPLTKAKTSN